MPGLGSGGGSYDLGYTPGSTAQGRSRFSPGQVGEGLGSSFDPNELMKQAWAYGQQGKEEDMDRQLRMDQAMRTRNASGQTFDNTQQAMPLRDMMQAKLVLEGLPQIRHGNVGQATEAFRHMPAASAMTGLQLPQSGFQTYAQLAGSSPPADPTAGAQAQNLQAQTAGLQQLGQQSNMARMYPGMFQGQYGSGAGQGR